MVERGVCNSVVVGSTPTTSSKNPLKRPLKVKKLSILVLAAILGVSGYVFYPKFFPADRVIETAGFKITLSNGKCTEPQVTQFFDMFGLSAENRSTFKNGTVEAEGRKVPLCYNENPKDPSQVFVVDGEGGAGFLKVPVKK